MKANFLRQVVCGALLSFSFGASLAQADDAIEFKLDVIGGAAGEIFDSTEFSGKALVLEFMANFCTFCHKNAANVDKLSKAFENNDDVEVFDISLDKSEAEVQKWIERHQPNHRVLWDSDKEAWSQVEAQYIPTMVVLDKCGENVLQVTGIWSDSDYDSIVETLNKITANDYKCGE